MFYILLMLITRSSCLYLQSSLPDSLVFTILCRPPLNIPLKPFNWSQITSLEAEAVVLFFVTGGCCLRSLNELLHCGLRASWKLQGSLQTSGAREPMRCLMDPTPYTAIWFQLKQSSLLKDPLTIIWWNAKISPLVSTLCNVLISTCTHASMVSYGKHYLCFVSVLAFS